MTVAAIIQARMGSSRLPGKVLRPLAGRPLLWHVVHRLRRARSVDALCIATSIAPADDAIARFAAEQGVRVVRGPEDDVLARFQLAAEATGADIVVRVTGDAPLVDPALLDRLVAALSATGAEFATVRPDLACIHEGVDPLSRAALERLVREAGADPVAREHVTGYIKCHPERFAIAQIDLPPEEQFAGARLSVDTPADLTFLETVHRRLSAPAGEVAIRDLVRLLRAAPELLAINGHVRQKRPEEASGTVLMRCDGGGALGLGHVSRCLALAEQLRDRQGLGVTFAMQEEAMAATRVAAAGFPVTSPERGEGEAAWIDRLIAETGARALVLDVRTDLAPTDVGRWRDAGIATLLIDDASPRRLAAHLAVYPPVPQVRDLDWFCYRGELLCGWEWVPMAPLPPATPRRQGPARVLVTMGASDPAGLTLPAVRALGQNGIEAEVRVVIGPGVSDAAALKTGLRESGCPLTLVENCSDLRPLMAETDLAVAAFGVTAYELAAMGVPAIHLCPTADHARSASAFARAGMAVNLGMFERGTDKALADAARGLLADAAARQRMATAGRSRLDGRGAMRLAALIGARLKREVVRPAA